MLTVLIIVGLVVLFFVCLWLGVLGFFLELICAIFGGGSGGSGSSGSGGTFGGGSFGGGGSSDDY
jgi:hypothetical protein